MARLRNRAHMTARYDTDSSHLEDPVLAIAMRWAGAFLASFSPPQTPRAE